MKFLSFCLLVGFGINFTVHAQTSKFPSWSSLSTTWKKAAPLSDRDLEEDWQFSFLSNQVEGTEVDSKKTNIDGSNYFVMNFIEDSPSEWGNSSGQRIWATVFNNMFANKLSEGPYEITRNTYGTIFYTVNRPALSERHAASDHFQYIYGNNLKFAWNCRVLNGKPDNMLCAMKLVAILGDQPASHKDGKNYGYPKSWVSSTFVYNKEILNKYKQYLNKVVAYYGFKK